MLSLSVVKTFMMLMICADVIFFLFMLWIGISPGDAQSGDRQLILTGMGALISISLSIAVGLFGKAWLLYLLYTRQFFEVIRLDLVIVLQVGLAVMWVVLLVGYINIAPPKFSEPFGNTLVLHQNISLLAYFIYLFGTISMRFVMKFVSR
ncbi:MAG: hypothetical protein WCJ56_07235 [bacterium]